MAFKNPFYLPFVILLSGAVFFSSCTDDPELPEVPENPPDNTFNPEKPNILEIDGEMFSIPSPIQTAFLIKGSGATYNAAYLNPVENASNYATNYVKALNLGIYGADLGYVTIYDNTEDAMEYLKSIRRMADELDVAGAFNEDLINRFSNNMGNQDSMLVLVADAYKAGDNYLKNNERNSVASLILAGGWVESLYFACRVAKDQSNPGVVERIGEQKSSLYSLIGLLQKNADSEEFNDLLIELTDLYYLFEEVESNYTFVEPSHDREAKLTRIACKTEVNVTPEQLDAITNKIEEIRSQISG